MKAFSRFLLVAITFALPALAQNAAQLKNELKAKESAATAKKDPDALFEAGRWAAEKSLAKDATRIYQAVLKMKPDHEGANLALGNQLVEGKWIPAKEAEALRKKTQDAEYAAKGMVQVFGVWVEKEHVEEAKRGIFRHEDELVTKDEKLALLAGKVRHPDTGELIDAKLLEQAKKRYFPIENGRMVDEKEANTWHSDFKRPWIVRTTYCALLSTLEFAKLEAMKSEADRAVLKVQPIFGNVVLGPTKRPVIIIAATHTEAQDLGAQLSDEESSAGVFVAKGSLMMPMLGEVHPAVCENSKDWGAYHLRHAAAMAYAHGVGEEIGIELPLWFRHGIGSYTSRFHTDRDAGWFGKQHLAKGGVRNVKAFFAGFGFNGEMPNTEVDYNLYQSGLMIAFALNGGDAATTAALTDVTAAFNQPDKKKNNVGKAIEKLQTTLIEAQPKIEAYLQSLIAKAP